MDSNIKENDNSSGSVGERESSSSSSLDGEMMTDNEEDEIIEASSARFLEEPTETTRQAYWKILIATSSVFASSYCLTNIFPYVGFMVVRFTGNTNEEAGYHAGVLASAFMFSRVLTSVVWGFLADRVGRKPILLIGCSTMVAFQLMLGFAPSFEIAVLSRLCTGFFSGVVGTSKTVASELAAGDATAQSMAMNIVSGAGSLGVILGPAFSGILYDPATQYPNLAIAQIQLFRDFPYLLPNIVSAFFSLASFLGILFLLPETLPNAVPLTTFLCGAKSTSSRYARVDTTEDAEGEGLVRDVELSRMERRESSQSLEANDQDDAVVEIASASANPRENASAELAAAPESGGFYKFLRVTYELWQRKDIRKSCYMYGYYSFISIYSSELFPLWLMAKSEVGGFGFIASTIGGTISASAILLLLFQAFIFRYISEAWKEPLSLLRWSLLLSGAFYLVSPILGLFHWENGHVLLVVLVLYRGAGSILNIVCFTQCNIMTNNSCAIHERATVNGIVMSLGSIFKALGPLCAGFSFAWSVNNGLPFPFDFFFSFILLAAVCAALAFYTYTMPLELNIIRKKSVSTVSTASSASLRSTTSTRGP
ncbi:Transporter, major facilitator family [Hondaea fermentalgiana]|uniref:Transporter, major facilitator family n=1 Tax=Hondaea fermentalgiana TaxID=2315210 RepID=A0A2R5G111_9STRA|nr:Transporter, major facilitator family [Hondaea fermentalgiana]|eukprot:GBG24215.1 Transporter, major facilitator family [Hondaea fermentalgiana]